MVICVDIGGTSSKVGLLDSSGKLHSVSSIPTKPSVDGFITSLGNLIEQALSSAQSRQSSICTGIGVAIAGFLTPEKDRLTYNSNLAWLEGFPLRQVLADRFQLPIELETDSNSACMAEYRFGCGGSSKRFLCVTVGTGVGVGMTVNGEPLRFSYGCLGDMGHVIVQPHGTLCSCGGRGCVEALISAPVLAAQYAEKRGWTTDTTLRDVIDAAGSGDEPAIMILRQAGNWLGLSIASMANILFPDHIAIAGGLSAAGPHVMETAELIFRQSAGTMARDNVAFTPAMLGPSATLIGAAWPFWNK